MLKPASATASQDIPATPTTAKTFLLLTSGPKFDKTTTQVGFESTKSLASHTEKLPSEELSTVDVLLNVIDVHMDLIFANNRPLWLISMNFKPISMHLREEWTGWRICYYKC